MLRHRRERLLQATVERLTSRPLRRASRQLIDSRMRSGRHQLANAPLVISTTVRRVLLGLMLGLVVVAGTSDKRALAPISQSRIETQVHPATADN
jgi:hypothetical protein